LKGYFSDNDSGERKKVAVFFPSGEPFFLDEDPNTSGNDHHEIYCGSNIKGVECYYYGNGDQHAWSIPKPNLSPFFVVDLTNAESEPSSVGELEIIIPVTGSEFTT
jgi:hypothetical protein